MNRVLFTWILAAVLGGVVLPAHTQEPKAALVVPKDAKAAKKAEKAEKIEKREKAQRPTWNGGKGSASMYGFHGMPGRGMESFFKSHPDYQKLVQDDVQMEKETRELAKKYRKATGSEKTAIQEELRQLITRHFQTRQERRLYEVKLMEGRIQKIRQDIEERGKKVEKIVEKRLNDLLDSGEDLRF